MSSPIWTPDALSSEVRRYDGGCWRLVEPQHLVSTLKLVDTLAEQELLEELIETTKPAIPPECRHLHYLLSTPFRYDAPYPRGSRFRRAGRTPGVFYAAEQPATAVAETVFHRLLFFAESPETPWPNDAAEHTAFQALVGTDRTIDLTLPPFDAKHHSWTHPTDYTATQALADAARATDIAILRYRSVRDPEGGTNLAVLRCAAFAAPEPSAHRTWRLRFGAGGVQALCEFPRERIEFPPDAFTDPRLSAFRWQR